MLSRWRGMQMMRVAALVALASLAACVSTERPQRARTAARPPVKARPAPNGPEYRACLAGLDTALVRYQTLPNQERGGGCAIIDSVKLLDFGVPTANLGAMTCDLAQHFTAWTRYAVLPAARLYLQSEVVRIETFGTYACRDVRGAGGTIAGRLSEHGLANAIDISAFVLADGRRISIANDWYAEGPTAAFLKAIHQSACKRFSTVLSPDYNSAHRDHLHFDMGGKGGYCR